MSASLVGSEMCIRDSLLGTSSEPPRSPLGTPSEPPRIPRGAQNIAGTCRMLISALFCSFLQLFALLE
eukprot:57096-Alexandrium_andersonii.AAC.1